MNTRNITIPTPCFAAWDAMTHESSLSKSRFCALCQKDVHDLSAMTRRQAETILAQSEASAASLCVRYRADHQGHIQFQTLRVTPTAPTPQQQGVRHLLATAALITSTLLAPFTATATEASDIEDVIWQQERAAAQSLSPLGLSLEEESSEDEPLIPTAIPAPDPLHYEEKMGKIMVE
jgi:hypothetical protein